MLVLTTDVLSTTNDRVGLPAMLGQMAAPDAVPATVLADAGYAGEDVVNAPCARQLTPLIAISREQRPRPYDFKPPPGRANGPKPSPHNRGST